VSDVVLLTALPTARARWNHEFTVVVAIFYLLNSTLKMSGDGCLLIFGTADKAVLKVV